MTAPVIESERLRLYELSPDDDTDADFLLELLNTPDFIRHIGDRGIRTRDDARRDIRERKLPMYARQGHGMWRVALRDGTSIGTCGLLRRESLPAPDIGYAFLPRHHGQGYAREAARASIDYARDHLEWTRLLAIVNPSNATSIRLLQDLGFGFESMACLPDIDHEVRLFSLALRHRN